MEKFIAYILQYGDLNQHQVGLIAKKATALTVKKRAFFSEAGKIAREVGFITDGIVRVFYHNDEGEEITKYFVEENNLIVDFESFDNEIPSTAYLQAITDCKLIIFSRKDWKELLNMIIGWDIIVYKIISKALQQKVERRSRLVSENATIRYLKFLETYPMVANRVPLSYVASYLGITQSSLSRIRKNIN